MSSRHTLHYAEEGRQVLKGDQILGQPWRQETQSPAQINFFAEARNSSVATS